MMNGPDLIADFSLEDFVKISTFPHPSQKSVMPVVAIKGDILKPLGTCFAISNHGLVLTARHVIDAVIKWGSEANEWQIGVIYVSEPTANDVVPDLMGGLIYVDRLYSSNEFDIGIMHLALLKRTDNGEFLPMPALRLSPGLPSENDICFTLGYHNSMVDFPLDNPYQKTIVQTYSASKGIIEEIHFPRRDNSFLTFPCFRTSLRNEHGMSGGPVLSKDGAVIGVVCSGYTGEPIYYVSLIGPALFLQLDGINTQGYQEKLFLYDFITGGAVVTDSTINQLIITRQDKTLEINYGTKPVFRGSISN